MSSKSAWATEQVPELPGLHRETISKKQKGEREREREHKIPTLGKPKVQALVTRLCRP